MRYTKIILTLLLLTIFLQAGSDRSIYRKNHGNENKVALVIGNSSYTHFSPLKNTLNDAKDMRNALKAKGFDVLYLRDGNLRSMKKIVRKFSQKLKQGGVGFFYYAGHGLEVNGKNYLIPIGAETPEEDEIEFESLAVDMVINKMENSHNRLNIIVLDACRNNPYGRGGGGGLAQINNAKGMYIAFATGPGKVASDGGSGSNGLFTKYLIKYISQPNLTLNEVFDNTRADVYRESDEKQLPWTSSSVIGRFYFQLQQVSASNQVDEAREERPASVANTEKKIKGITVLDGRMWQNPGITVLDGRMWQNPSSQKTFTWEKAVEHCERLSLGGYDDWRLPDMDELRGLGNIALPRGADYDTWEKWFETHKDQQLKNLQGDGYFIKKEFLKSMPKYNSRHWSSSIHEDDSSLAWYIHFPTGNGYRHIKMGTYYVFCVRGQK